MSALKNKQLAYKVLALVFAIAGLVWIIGGLTSRHYLFYPFLGLLNWGIAWYCQQASQAAS
jgi:hypothetical protein